MDISVLEALVIALAGFSIVFLLLVFLIVAIKVITKVVVSIESSRSSDESAAPAAVPAAATPAAPAASKEEEKPAKPWDGKLQLIDCDEETAACIMAIISDETDIPLDELQFRRIRAL